MSQSRLSYEDPNYFINNSKDLALLLQDIAETADFVCFSTSAGKYLKPLLNEILRYLDISIRCGRFLLTAMKFLLSFLISNFVHFVTVIVPKAIKYGIKFALRALKAVKDALLDVCYTVGKPLLDKFRQYAAEKPIEVVAGEAVGMMSGAATGALVGSAAGPVGMLVGAAVGSLGGFVIGGFSGYHFT